MNIEGLEIPQELEARLEGLPETMRDLVITGMMYADLRRRVAESVPLPKEAWPGFEELHGDLQEVAGLIGIGPALLLAQVFDGSPIRLYGIRQWARRHRDRCIRADYDTGRFTVIELGRRYALSDRQISNILGRPD